MVSYWEAVISSSLEELASSSSSSSPDPSSASLSSKAFGEGEGDATKPPRWAYRHSIWPTRVFTWYNSVVSVSRWASMHSSCAMTASSDTPPTESGGGWNGKGWRSRRLGPWPLWSKLGLTSSNKRCASCTHDGEVSRLRIEDRKMTNDPHDSRRENEIITGRYIPIDIYERENEMRRKVYSKVLNEGKKKASMGLCNWVIVRQWSKNKYHHHVKESWTFCKVRAWGVLTTNPYGRYLTKVRYELVFGHSLQMLTTKVVRMRYPKNV